MKIYYIDLFCGAGGTSTGIHIAGAKVLACVNHDPIAIQSHKENHPEAIHFIEDIRSLSVIKELKKIVTLKREEEPGCVINLWASLECTNFSKAKGGLPRDADSRTLAEFMYQYIEAVGPDFFFVENVREFMAWGPLDEKGKPISKHNGTDYIKWVNNICRLGYKHDRRILNSANFGAFTSRERLFIQFAKEDKLINWPEPTHAKAPKKQGTLFNDELKQWRSVKEVLELDKTGKSIFNRKKPLVENTLKRIYAGLLKFVANGDESFILKYNSMSQKGLHVAPGINEPCPTIACQNRLGIVNVQFLQSYYGNGGTHSIDMPCPTVTTVDRFSNVTCTFIDQQYGNSLPASTEQPLGTITINPKFCMTQAFLLNPQYKSNGNSIDMPCPTVIASQNKLPLGIVSIEQSGDFTISIYENDSETMVKIKLLMAQYGIIDIKTRMLFVSELKKIQGFPGDYVLRGNQAEQKKFIGNSVEVNTAAAIIAANISAIQYHLKAA